MPNTMSSRQKNSPDVRLKLNDLDLVKLVTYSYNLISPHRVFNRFRPSLIEGSGRVDVYEFSETQW